MVVEGALFEALGHPFRVELLAWLRAGEVCVCHLIALSGKTQPYVSKHLAELRAAGLVVDRKEGLRVYYRLADPAVGTLLDVARLLLVRLGRLKPEELAPHTPREGAVPGCECPACAATKPVAYIPTTASL